MQICLQQDSLQAPRQLTHCLKRTHPFFAPLPPVHNTVPNSALRLEDGSFAPAHMLPDARLERAGRNSKVERQVGTFGGSPQILFRLPVDARGGYLRLRQLPAGLVTTCQSRRLARCTAALRRLPSCTATKPCWPCNPLAPLLVCGCPRRLALPFYLLLLLPPDAIQCSSLLQCLPQVSSVGGERRTAGLLIIGDEILSAKVEDVNTRFLCAELRSIGWTVEKVRWLVGKCGGGCCVRCEGD